MAITFQQGTRITMVYKGNRYEFPVSEASVSRTFLETTQNKKTIHNPNAVKNSFITESSVASLNFGIYIGKSQVERPILDWFGFKNLGEVNQIDLEDTEVSLCDIYIVGGGSGEVYSIESCAGVTMSFTLSRKELVSIKINASAPDVQQVSSIPETGTLYIQNPTEFYNAPIVVPGFSNISNLTCEVTKTIDWLKQKSVHDIGTIYKVSNPIYKNLAIAGTITQYKTDSSVTNLTGQALTLQYGDDLVVSLPSCILTSRWEMGAVHTKAVDYKLLPNAVGTYIKF